MRLLALVLAALAAAGPAAAATAPPGKKVFQQHCASCHTLADAGAAGTVGPNLDQLQPSSATVSAQVRSGGGGMPSFQGVLSSTQIGEVAAYVAKVAGASPTGKPAPTVDQTKIVRRHTAKDTAIAKRVLLRLSDLGKGWTASPVAAGPTSLTCGSLQPRQSDLVETGAAVSPNFRGSSTGPFVSQSVWVYKTDVQAAKLWRRVVGPGLARCLKQTVEAGSTKDVTFTVKRSGELAVPKLAKRAAGFRVVATATSPGQSVTAYYDMIVVSNGRTVTQISFAAFQAPIPAAVEITLARAVAARMGSAAVA